MDRGLEHRVVTGVGHDVDLAVGEVRLPGLADRGFAEGGVVLARDDEHRGLVASDLGKEVRTGPGLERTGEALGRRVAQRMVNNALDPGGRVAVAGGEVDDPEPLTRVFNGAPEQVPPGVVERRRRGADRCETDQFADPAGSFGEDPQHLGAAHRVADQREGLHVKGIREREHVIGDLVEAVVPALVHSGAIAAVVGEVVAEPLAVEIGGKQAPAVGRAEPTVQDEDMVVAGTDRDARDRHAPRLARPRPLREPPAP